MRTPWRFALLVVLVPQATWAGWASLGQMPAPTRDGQALTWRSPQGVLALTVLSPEIVRVRFVPRPELGRDHSYTALTGRMPLPPRWALGYKQCRYSYYPEARLRLLADTFRVKRIPADVLWLDIHYLDGYNPFTWDRERFPDPPKLIGDLGKQGFKVVTIIDPHPKKQPGWAPYDTGLAGNHLVRNADGTVYEAPVWPSQAERNPGPSVFPDFSKPAAREWWGGLYKPLLDQGVAGIWNDMNEPAVFTSDASGTMPFDVRFDGEGLGTDHREIHNVYGMLMSLATREGLRRLRPDHRPFVLTRATYAGGQRYAALWPGDNVSDWDDFRGTIPMFANLGLSGFPFVGADIGGFADAPSAELFTRWMQTGVFYPFMRTHTTLGTPEREPWSYGVRHEDLNRRAIELRYQLLTSQATLCEDDGESIAYERGGSLRRRFEQQGAPSGVTVRVGAAEGSYRPAAGDLVLRVEGANARRVLVDGAEVPALNADDDRGTGWRQVDGAVWLRVRDRWVATDVRAEF